ncbi:hypothetical protein NBRC116188_09420 [Oceaniserpentilla sp. 4NH20-0058]|uniref:hypothetical protein n=1 Tax=Oceaniserpentilla sp. 4NH20-0058 TaxID=3127660 RepID=UPI0031028B2D
MFKFSLLILLFLTYHHCFSELYRCEQANGKFQYTDKPCPTSGTTYTPKTNITQYKDIDDINIKRPINSSTYTQATCPYFSSTELRNLRVKDEFKKGMTYAHIENRFGKPDSRSANKWNYKNQFVNRTFNFKQGCLTSWQIKWEGKESKISKFRDER